MLGGGGAILTLGQSGGGPAGGPGATIWAIGKFLADKALKGGWYPWLVVGGVVVLVLVLVFAYKYLRFVNDK